jgi:HK97 family phage major capsid protein
MATLLEQARELKADRFKLVTANRDLIDKAEAEKRDFTAEEQAEYDKRHADIEGYGKRISRLEEQDKQARDMAPPDPAAPPTPENRDQRHVDETAEQRTERIVREVRAMSSNDYAALAEVRATGRWFRSGSAGLSEADRRALEVTDSTEGGYLQPPQQFIAQLIKNIDDAVFIRGLATTFSVPMAESLGAPSLDADPADPIWTSELGTGDEDSAMAFGKRELRPHPLAKRIKVSNTLMRKAAIGPEALVRARLAYKHGTTQENAFLNGDGVAKPLGVFTASADGISTARDVSTGNLDTSIQADGLIEAKYTLKGGYWAMARWLFHRTAVKQIAKLKDGDGQYIWQPGLQMGQPDRILAVPFLVSEFAPSTFTTGLYVGILGDFRHYWIADALSMTIQRLVELYAETNQTGFISRLECDGMPVLEEAFVRVKLG